jgi:hypothetical protein
MAHEIAKLMLEHAETFLGRTEAVETALSLGMPLQEIEAYLDWLDHVRHGENLTPSPHEPPPRDPDDREES